jgi:hypothetical protein
VALAGYALLLTAGTHWPRLQLGSESVPAPDKIIHMLAFGALAALLWLTGWFRRPWHAGAVAALWVALDEGSQGLSILGRTSSLADLLAGELGVLVAVAWCWALRPVGGPGNRVRLAWHAFVREEVFARPRGWVALGLGAAEGALGALVLVVPAILIAGDRRGLLQNLVLGTAAGGLAGAVIAAAAAQRRAAAGLAADQPCFACGAGCRGTAFDERGRGTCPACGAALHGGQWIEPPAFERRTQVRAVAHMGIAVTAVTLAAAALGLGLAVLLWRAGWARRIALDLGLMADQMQLAMAVAVAGLGCAAGVRVLRTWLAQAHDRQAASCRHCGHDLRATPVAGGVGTCGECGARFARIEP